MSSTPPGAGDFATCSRMASERAMAPSLSRLPRAPVRRARAPAPSPAALADVLLRRTLVAISAGRLSAFPPGWQPPASPPPPPSKHARHPPAPLPHPPPRPRRDVTRQRLEQLTIHL